MQDSANDGGAMLAAERLAARLGTADTRAVARAISHVEDDTPVGRRLLDLIYGRIGGARRVGVTGPPGSGKSTLVNGLAEQLRRAGHRVAILAVDPTSPFTGGAILGDRVRMTAVESDPGLYVRSLASRGNLGGVSSATYEASEILEAAGFEWILIETVGVGQAELEIVELADTVVLLLVPESGDSVQVMKAGIMEIADIFVVNKHDREGGDRLVRDIEQAMELGDWRRAGGWHPPVCPAVAMRAEGLPAIGEAIARHGDWLRRDEALRQRIRAEKAARRTRLLLKRALVEQAWEEVGVEKQLGAAIAGIVAHQISPYRWVEGILSHMSRRRGA